MKLLFLLLFVMLLGVGWAKDALTLEGERTVYTARCDGGAWVGLRCTGKLIAGERHRFRALKAKHEVLFWTVGSDEPSGKYDDCTIENSRNWVCRPRPNEKPTITYELVSGHPRAGIDPPTPSFHAVRKWKWWILQANFVRFSEADR